MFNQVDVKRLQMKKLTKNGMGRSSVSRTRVKSLNDTAAVNQNISGKLAPAGLLLTTLAASLLMSSNVSAQCEGRYCVCKPSELQFKTPDLNLNDEGKYPFVLDANDIDAQGENVVTLSGDAQVRQGRQAIVADTVKYYRQTERVLADGNVEMISEQGDYLSSDTVDVHVPTQVGSLTNTKFKLSKGLTSAEGVDTVQIESRGSADVVNLEGEGLIRMENARYTTCAEGDESVMIGASKLELDRLGGVGTARNATIRFKGVPIFYSPYLSFPLNDKRKTGFLAPGFGSDEDSGSVLELPWYWNIAKNQDATITPRYYSERGVQLGVEYRRMSQSSRTYVYGETLSGDDFYAEENEVNGVLPDDFDDDRSLLTIQHFHQFSDSLSGSVNYNDVSDIDYFDDFRNEVRYYSATYVPRDIELNYSHEYFRVSARAIEYQIIDDNIANNRLPYERIPSLGFATNLPEGPFGLKYGLNATYTDFSLDAPDDDDGSVTTIRSEGTRTTLNPYVELPFENLWGYTKPRVSVYSTNYSLDEFAEGVEDSPSFTVPIFSLDSGVVFERNTNWFGDGVLQTLEPRVYYVYAPEDKDEQDEAPVFDTSQATLNNFSNIFRENRFFGSDRVGDTNQVTIGLTSRILDNESGDQRLKASIGQLVLLDDLEQGLSANAAPIESGLGDFLAELSTVSGDAWTTYSFIQYDHDESELRTARFSLGYAPRDQPRKRINVGYYKFNSANSTSSVDQLTLNASWPISDRWQIFGDERYSIEDSEGLETTVGLEYNGCCWKVRFFGTDRIQDRDIEQKKTSFFVEFELTSLGSIRTGL